MRVKPVVGRSKTPHLAPSARDEKCEKRMNEFKQTCARD